MFKSRIGKKASLLIALMVSLTLVIGGITYAASTGTGVKDLSLDQAVKLGLENNYDLKLSELDLTTAERAYSAAKDVAKEISGDKISSYSLAQTKWVSPRSAQMNLTLATKKLAQAQKQTQVYIEEAYSNVLKAQKLLTIKQDSLNYAQQQLKIAQDSYKLGTVAKSDVVSAEALVASYQAALSGALNDLSINTMKLNQLIGLDLDTKLKLTSALSYKPMNDTDINVHLNNALKDSVDILTVREQQAVKELEFEMAKKFYAGGVLAYDNSEIAAQQANIKVSKTEVATALLVKTNYMSIKSLEQQIAWKQKEVEKQQETLRVTLLKYKAGLATSQDVKKATLDYETAEESLTELIYSHNKLMTSFKYDLFSASTGSY